MAGSSDPAYDVYTALGQFAPGVVLTRDIESGLAAAYAAGGYRPLTSAQVLAVVLPLMQQGNPPEYTPGAPPANPVPMPQATPVFGAALPAQPDVLLAVDGANSVPGAQWGTVATFAKGLPRFQDSNPDPLDGWAIDQEGETQRG